MATSMGFEPTLSAVTGRHVNRYTTRPSQPSEILFLTGLNNIMFYQKSQAYFAVFTLNDGFPARSSAHDLYKVDIPLAAKLGHPALKESGFSHQNQLFHRYD